MNFEIIIPTVPGRTPYLGGAIGSCLDQEHEVAVLVSNNGGSQEVRDLVASFGTPRIRLVEPHGFLPMPIHWDFALGHTTADVVTILGDDDAMMPSAVSCAATILNERPQVSALVHYPAQYFWPDFHEEARRNRFTFKQGDGSVVERDARQALQDVLTFRTWYGVLPFLYHGFVRRSVLTSIAERQGGSVFLKAAPDIYSDMAIAASIERYAIVNSCLTVGGQGAKSTGASLVANTAEGKSFILDMPPAMLPKRGAKSVNLMILDSIREVAAQFDLPHGPLGWRPFVEAVCREAVVLDPTRRREILDGLLYVSEQEFTPTMHAVTRVISKLTDLAAAPIASLLRKRDRQHVARMEVSPFAGSRDLAIWLSDGQPGREFLASR